MKEDLESKIDYMWESYELTYNQALTLKHYELKAEDAAEHRRQKKELQKQIKGLGNININAIEEYKEVGERYEFLKGQYDDIKEAEAKLLTMIDELNLAMKEQFTKEFGSIQQMFTTVFQDLFEGGTASLELMEYGKYFRVWYPHYCTATGKETAKHYASFWWGEGIDSDCLTFCDSEFKTIAVLSS